MKVGKYHLQVLAQFLRSLFHVLRAWRVASEPDPGSFTVGIRYVTGRTQLTEALCLRGVVVLEDRLA